MAELGSCPSAFWRGLRLEALDATLLDAADIPENEWTFGRPTGRSNLTAQAQSGAYPL